MQIGAEIGAGLPWRPFPTQRFAFSTRAQWNTLGFDVPMETPAVMLMVSRIWADRVQARRSGGSLPVADVCSNQQITGLTFREGILRAKPDELQRLQRETEAELASFTPALLTKAFRGGL